MKVGDIVFYRQKEYEVISTLEGGWLLIKRAAIPTRWVHESNVMKLRGSLGSICE